MFPLLPEWAAAHLAAEHERLLRIPEEFRMGALLTHAEAEEEICREYLPPEVMAELRRQHERHESWVKSS